MATIRVTDETRTHLNRLVARNPDLESVDDLLRELLEESDRFPSGAQSE